MDFPSSFNSIAIMVDSMDELKSTILHLLKNSRGEFLQSLAYGSLVEIHSSDISSIERGIKTTIEEIPGASASVKKQNQDDENPEYHVQVVYKSNVLVFDLNLNEL